MKNTTIKFRLIAIIAIFLAFFVVSFSISLLNMNKMIDNTSSIYKVRLSSIQSLIEADRDAYQSNLAINHIIIKDSISDDAKATLISDITTNLQQVDERYQRFLGIYNGSESEPHPELETIYNTGYKELASLTDKFISAMEADNHMLAANIYFNKYMPVFEEVRSVLDEFTNVSSMVAETEFENIMVTSANSKLQLSGVFLALLVVAIIAGIFLVNSITKPLQKGITFAEEIAKGNLTSEIEDVGRNELGQLANALRNMSEKLKEVVTEIISGAGNISSASEQISSSAQSMSQGANEQAASVEQVSSTMEEIAANIQQNTENAQQTEKISATARNGISDVSTRSQETVSANKLIAEKIDIINDIAFQTNILALNAAVEAARAGEHGKGFAVVAAEVRKLAERSKVAAEEIVGLANSSLDLAQNAGQKMEEILPEVEKTANLVKEISAASIEQNNGAAQINNAIQQLNGVTQQNASVSEELATSSEEMNSQADQLMSLISFFNVGNENGNSVVRRRSTSQGKVSHAPLTNTSKKEVVKIKMKESDADFEEY